MARWLIRFHRLIGLVVVGVIVFSVGALWVRGLRRDYRLEAFVAEKSEAYELLRRVMDEFISTEFAIIAVSGDVPRSESMIEAVRSIERSLSDLDSVARSVSVAGVLDGVPGYLRSVVSARVWTHPLFVDNLVSRDGRTTAILLQMSGEASGGSVRAKTVGRLRSIVSAARERYGGFRILLAGPYVTLIDMYDYVNRDLYRFTLAALALVLLTVGLLFRRIGCVVFAMVVSGEATAFALGLASVCRVPASLITQMILILVTVLSVANCVHLIVADDEDRDRVPADDWRERARRVFGSMWKPCCAAMITTMVGFGTVCVSRIAPVRAFGELMVVGLAAALVLSLLTVPWLARLRAPGSPRADGATLGGWLRRVGDWAVRRRRGVCAGFALAAVLFGASLGLLKFESDFVKSFRPNSEVRRSYEFIESHLSPTGSIEVVVRRSDGATVVGADSIRRLHRAGLRIVEAEPAVKKAMTPADLLTLGGDGLPASGFEVGLRLAAARAILGAGAVRNFINADRTAMRMNLRATEGISVQDKLAMVARIRAVSAEQMGGVHEVTVTGVYPFYATLVAGLWRDQFRSLGLTVPCVFLVLLVVLRSARAAAVAMVPTVLPVVFCLGTMGWLGVPVNMTTAMMLSVTVGIAVDDAVHYLWRFRERFAVRGRYAEALLDAHGSVGRACVFTTVVIAGGFWILTMSEFLPTAYFGGLVGFTMCCALAGNLLLLPALLVVFKPFGPESAAPEVIE